MDKTLSDFGFVLSSSMLHANEYKFDDVVLYTTPTKKLNLVISPVDYVFVKQFESAKYHNSNLTAFPKELNKGKRKIHYGYKIVFDNKRAMKQFLEGYLVFKHK